MDVIEVESLARWINEHVKPAMSVYELLATTMEQNATNSSKAPLREHLEAVKQALLSMPVEQLSYQQTDLLGVLEIEGLLGKKGWHFVEQTVKEGNFDPATAAQDIRKAKQTIDSAINRLKQLQQSLREVGFLGEPEYDTSDNITVRIRFKGGVEIVNVTQLKKWTAEWYEISRGLAMAADERPEDVEVKGATTGSLILILGTTLSVATLISLIMKQVASTVKSSMEVAHTLQDWKVRKVADEAVERVLRDRCKAIEKSGTDDALNLVKEHVGDRIAGEVENALKKSIDKMFNFAGKGGEVDMLPPPLPADKDNVDDVAAKAISAIKKNVEEMRILKAATQLLIEDGTDDVADKGEEA